MSKPSRDLMERLLPASGAEESPVDREEHATLIAKVVERAREARDLADALIERARSRRR